MSAYIHGKPLIPCKPSSLIPRHPVDPDMWVSASTSWGISVAIGVQRVIWRLIPVWNTAGRDIGWAKTIALELAILMIVD